MATTVYRTHKLVQALAANGERGWNPELCSKEVRVTHDGYAIAVSEQEGEQWFKSLEALCQSANIDPHAVLSCESEMLADDNPSRVLRCRIAARATYAGTCYAEQFCERVDGHWLWDAWNVDRDELGIPYGAESILSLQRIYYAVATGVSARVSRKLLRKWKRAERET